MGPVLKVVQNDVITLPVGLYHVPFFGLSCFGLRIL